MIRALDPLFSRLTRTRQARRAAAGSAPAVTGARTSGPAARPERPRWDAPAHWLEPEKDW